MAIDGARVMLCNVERFERLFMQVFGIKIQTDHESTLMEYAVPAAVRRFLLPSA